MTDTAVEAPEEPKKKSKLPLILGVVLALVGAGGGFFASQSGLLTGGDSADKAEPAENAPPIDDIAYVPIDPLIVSLSNAQQVRHLRFQAQLEVNAGYEADVSLLIPRVMDVLNGYLRAIELTDLEDSFALARLRAQMLKRVQVVVGDGRVRDLLITEFVLN